MPQLSITLPKLHKKQQLIYDDPSRFKVLVCGRRFGKTKMGVRTIGDRVLQGKRTAYFTPVYRQQREVWNELNRALEPIITRSVANEKVMQFATGGLIEFWNYGDTVRGTYYDDVILDEAALMKDETTFEAVIRPLLSDTQGNALFLSTPRGRTWYYEYFRRGNDSLFPNWASWQFPTWENPYIPQSEIDDAKRGLAPQLFGQEYAAEFTSLAGAVYPDWFEGQGGNVSDDAEYDPAYPVYWAVDDGYADPRVILLLQVRPFQGKPDRICVFNEYVVTNEISDKSIKEVLKLPYKEPTLVYHDPSAAEFAGACMLNLLNTWGGYNKKEGINIVRKYIKDAQGERLLQVHSRCRTLIDSMMNCSYTQGVDPKVVHDQYSHATDALRYFIATFRR